MAHVLEAHERMLKREIDAAVDDSRQTMVQEIMDTDPEMQAIEMMIDDIEDGRNDPKDCTELESLKLRYHYACCRKRDMLVDMSISELSLVLSGEISIGVASTLKKNDNPKLKKAKKVTKKVKKAIISSHQAQRAGAPPPEQWAFLKWNKKGAQKCRRAPFQQR